MIDYRKTGRELTGRWARTRIELRNSHGSIPERTLVQIEGKHAGLDVRSAPCECCGGRLRIGKVPPEHLTLVSVEDVSDAEARLIAMAGG